jgi:hypothetical protein
MTFAGFFDSTLDTEKPAPGMEKLFVVNMIDTEKWRGAWLERDPSTRIHRPLHQLSV